MPNDTISRERLEKPRADEIDAALLEASARDVLGHEIGLDDAAVRQALDPRPFVVAHEVPGRPAPDRVREAIQHARGRLAESVRAEVEARTRGSRAPTTTLTNS
jgi:hypothetical protein